MKDVYQKITDHIIGSVDEAGAWKPCWQGMASGHPHNAISGHRYRGVNILSCWVSQMCGGYPTQQWASYKQWQSAGAQVRKGESGTPIIFYKKIESEDPDEDGQLFARASYVFNAAQVQGWDAPAQDVEQLTSEQRIKAIEEWLTAVETEAMIEETSEGRAYYRPSTDTITMPRFEQFNSPEHFYAVLFHELTHWTGARQRLDREFRRAREDYAKEELVAELGAAFICAEFGIDQVTRDDHTTYIASWLKALKNDKRLIVRAASLASKAADYLQDVAEAGVSRVPELEEAA